MHTRFRHTVAVSQTSTKNRREIFGATVAQTLR
jgi:hypothetical protein